MKYRVFNWRERVERSARSLAITWGDTDQYWNWTAMPESRFTLKFSTCLT